VINYVRVPSEIHLSEVKEKETSWSPSMYRRVIIPTSAVNRVANLLEDYIQGTEVGSLAYVRKSTFNFVRTKAIQDYTTLTYPKNDANPFITPKAYHAALKTKPARKIIEGDILYTRGGAVGQVAIAYNCGDAIASSHILKLIPKENPFYLFAFLRHPICRLQQEPSIKGAIRALDNWNKDTLLNCLIPFPNQPAYDRVIKYVSALMEAIVEKEKAVRDRHVLILRRFTDELKNTKTSPSFHYECPTVNSIQESGRMDACFWSPELKKQLWRLFVYRGGIWESIYKAGYKTRRGPNLAVSVSGVGYYYDDPYGSAQLHATPGDITDYMTIPRFRYYGNARRVDIVRKGEVMFAAKGKREVSIGHTYVHLADADLVTNFDSFLIDSGNISRNVFLALFLNYCKQIGIFARLSDTSNGGSFVEGYFSFLPIPKFQDDFQVEMTQLYHHDAPEPPGQPTLDTFVQWHRRWNFDLGIWELDREMKALQHTLSEVQEQIIEGKTVNVPI